MLGGLIAFHEHLTFANALLMGVNPFDEFVVTLGKKKARHIKKGEGHFDASIRTPMDAAGL